MRGLSGFAFALPTLFGRAAAAPAETPTRVLEERVGKIALVISPSSTVVGSSSGTVETFRGIPYALPPMGPLRLKPPVRLNTSLGNFDATGIEAACPQFLLPTGGDNFIASILGEVTNMPFFQTVTNQKEDCLTINVIRPAGVKAGARLPVLFWIYGGAFEV
jgi:carboxylesterase type B